MRFRAGRLRGLREDAGDELSPAAHAELLEHGLQVVVHGVARDEQALGELARVEAFDQQGREASPTRFAC
jgi:transposase